MPKFDVVVVGPIYIRPPLIDDTMFVNNKDYNNRFYVLESI